LTKQCFYWSVDFESGYHISQFTPDGKEILIKDITGPECWTDKGLNMNSNFFGKLEAIHGRVTKVSWKPFSKELTENILKQDPSAEIILFKEAKDIYRVIPDNKYATIKKTIDIQYKPFGKTLDTNAYMSAVSIGEFPRKFHWIKRLIGLKPKGKIYEFQVGIKW